METKCVCIFWASPNLIEVIMHNGHNQSCEHFKKDFSGAMEMISGLVDGIDNWAAEEDGVPRGMWEVYSKAHMIVRGSLPSEKQV